MIQEFNNDAAQIKIKDASLQPKKSSAILKQGELKEKSKEAKAVAAKVDVAVKKATKKADRAASSP